MFWQKSWWETRWLFLFFMIVMFIGHVFMLVIGYDSTEWIERLHRNTVLGETERQALNSYRGFAWAAFIRLFFNFAWPHLAVTLGAMCLVTFCPMGSSHGASRLFTFSLPVSRRKALLSQAAVGYSEMFLLALIPMLFLPLIAHFQGQWFSWSDVLIYALLVIFGGASFFFFSFLMAVIFGNWLATLVIVDLAFLALYLSSLSVGMRPWWNILGVMAGESYFYHGRIPWLGLAISLTASALMMFAAVRIYERRDF
jgi:hypothetical protein